MIVKAKNKYMAFILPPIIMYVLDYLTQTAAQTYSFDGDRSRFTTQKRAVIFHQDFACNSFNCLQANSRN